MYTTNFLAANPSPKIYHGPYSKKTISTLETSFPDVNAKLHKLPSIELDLGLKSSPIQSIIDVSYQSAQSWEQFIDSIPKMTTLKEEDIITYYAIDEYRQRFKTEVFDSFSSYFNSNPYPFKGNANQIVSDQFEISTHLQTKFKTPPNVCCQFSVRYPLDPTQMTQTTHTDAKIDENEEEDDDDDDDAYSNLLEQWSPKQQKYHSSPSSIKELGTFDLTSKYDTLTSIMRTHIPCCDLFNIQPTPYAYTHYIVDIVRFWDTATIYDTTSTISQRAIECRHVLNMLLSSIYSVQNTTNTLTILYIVYNDCAMPVYAYITNEDHKCFGSRISERDFMDTIPYLFEDTTIADDVKKEMDTLRFKKDTVYEEYKHILSKQCVNVFDLQLNQTVNQWNVMYPRSMHVKDIKNMVQVHNVKKDYFRNDMNRTPFIHLVRERGYTLAAADKLWFDFGGVISDKDIETDCKEQNDIDLDLDGLRSDILESNLLNE